MKRVVKYIAIDPYYSDIIHTFIGSTSEEIDNIQEETENFMNQSSIFNLYKREIIDDSDERRARMIQEDICY